MRGPRISYPGAIIHVLNRFVDKHPFFKDNSDYNMFLNIYFEEANSYNIKTFAYCLLNNHFHFVIQILSDNLSDFLRRFLTRVAKKMNKKYNRTGHLFQGRSKTLIVESEIYFNTVIGYVLLNPVKANISKTIYSYKWSSIHEMMNIDSKVLDISQLSNYLFGKQYENFENYKIDVQNWLENIEPQRINEDFKKNHKGCFLSSKNFRHKILKINTNERRNKIGIVKNRRKTDKIIKEYSANEIIKFVESYVEKTENIIKYWKTAEKAKEQLMCYIAHKVLCWTWCEIREKFNLTGSLSKASVAFDRLIKDKIKNEIAEKMVLNLK